jgi:iron complex outermembrane receptor protein
MKKYFFLFFLSFGLLKSNQQDTLKSYTAPEVQVSQDKAIRRVSVVPFQELNRKEIQSRTANTDLPLMLNSMTSVISYSENGNWIGYSNMSLRGFDQRRISVYINGIPQNDPEDHNVYWINFADIQESLESIQVQRGAGIANYGSPSIAGSINLQTKNLGKEKGINIFSGAGYQQFGDDLKFNNNKFKVEYSSGLVDEKYSFYGKLGSINSFGYRNQSHASLTNWFFSGARYDKNVSTQINVYGGMQQDGLAYYGLPKEYIDDPNLRRSNYSYWQYDTLGNIQYNTPTRPQEIELFSQPHYEILNTWKVNDKVTFHSSLFYYSSNGYFDYNGGGWADWSFRIDPSNGFDSTYYPSNSIIRSNVENKHGGWIPRVDIKHNKGTLTLGGEMRVHRSDHWGKINFAEQLPLGYDPDFKFYSYEGAVDVYSLFAREMYDVNDKFSINMEGQLVYKKFRFMNEMYGNNFAEYYNQNNQLISAEGVLFEVPYLFFNPKLGLNYKIDKLWNLFGMVAITSREPRMNNLYNASEGWSGTKPNFFTNVVDGNNTIDFSRPLVTPEQMLDIETGINYTSQDFIFDANIYWMEFSNELVRDGQLNVFGSPIDANVPRTRHIGLELLAKKRFITDYGNITLEGNTTLSRNRIVDYDFEYIEKINDSTEVKRLLSMAGNQIGGFPDFMANAIIQYDYSDFNMLLIGKYVGEMRTDNFGNFRGNQIRKDYTDNVLPDYFVMNLAFSYEFKNFMSLNSLRLNLQINNLLNEFYVPYAVGRRFFPAAERSIFFGIQMGL